MRRISFGVVLCCFYSMCHWAYAQDTLSTATLLDEVVVTGQYEPQSAAQSTYQTRVIPMEAIVARGATRLGQVLSTELNMRFSQDPALGGAQMTMQGFTGQNIKILIDGMPIVGRQGVKNEIDINQININTIERIEIVEGPMSDVYGANALAGVINIITRTNDQQKWVLGVAIQEKTVGNEYSLFKKGIHTQSIWGAYTWKKWRANANFSKNYFGGFQGSISGRQKWWLPKDQIMTDATLGYRFTGGEANYKFDFLYEDIQRPGAVEVDKARDQNYITRRMSHRWNALYNFSDFLKLDAMVAYTDYQRQVRTVIVDIASGDKRFSLGEGDQSTSSILGVTARIKALYRINDRLSTQWGIEADVRQGSGLRIRQDNQGTQDYALFGSAEWQLVEKLKVRVGMRLSYNVAYRVVPFIPSLNIKWDVIENHSLRVSYGRGYRAPSLRELYFNFFDANHSIEGNPDLQSENSHSTSVAWQWKIINEPRVRWTMDTRYFYNYASNKIEIAVKPQDNTVFSYFNLAQYQSQGFTLRQTVGIKKYLRVKVGVACIGVLPYVAGKGQDGIDPFLWSPEVNAHIAYTVNKVNATLSLYYKYTGAMPSYIQTSEGDIVRNTIPDYHTADLVLTKQAFKNFTITIGVHNLFDVTDVFATNANTGGVHTVGSRRPIEYGRSYLFGLTYRLNKK